VTFGDELEVLVRAMAEAGAAYEEMRADEVRERFPGLSVSTSAVFEPGSGVIAADVCLRVLGEVEGVEVRQKTRVVTCDDDGRRVRIVVEAGGERDELEASAVVVCGGPWTAGLVFGAAGFRPMATLEQVAYLAPVEVSIDELPVFVERRRPWFYGLPVRSSGLMKVSLHGGGPAVSLESLESPLSAGSPGFPEPPQVGSAIDRPDPALVGELMASTRRVLPGLAPEPVTTERCVYDNSPDGDFVIDRIGNVVFGSGTSGHGFKFGPLLGELLADLASGSPHDKSLGSAADLGRFASGRLRSSRSGGGPTIHP
jgi:sarcosine oxidase